VIQYQKEGQSSGSSPIVFPEAYKTGEPIFVKQ
jgi:hypothetical protein